MTGLQSLRLMNQVLGRLAPHWAADRARQMFTTPRRRPPRPWEADVEARAERQPLQVGWSTLRWTPDGTPRGAVLCMHGWEGRATQFGALADRLVHAGYAVVAVDGPGHGASPEDRAHPVAFARALLDADRELGPFDAGVGHSMGAGALGFALGWGLAVERVALLASPANIHGVVQRFGMAVGLPPEARDVFVQAMADHVGFAPEDLDVSRVAAHLSQPALIIHDPEDREVPLADGEAIAARWPGAILEPVTGLGHRRLLRDPAVLDRVVTFVTSATPG